MSLQASEDALTGLANHRSLQQTLSDLCRSSRNRDRRIFSMLMIDVDHFKLYNDTFGHLEGDIVLKKIARVILVETRHADLAARYGGEEFSVILKGSTLETTLEIAERLRASIEAYPFILPNGEKLTITVSIGAAVYPDTVKQIEALKEISDQKLYEAKRTGRNKVCI